MRAIREQILDQKSETLSCRDFDQETFDCPYHRHPEFEVLRIDQSTGRVLVGDYVGEFQPGQIYLFGSNLPHAFINVKGTRLSRSRCLQFDSNRIFEVSKHLPETTPTINRIYQRASRGLLLQGISASTISDQLDHVFAFSGMAAIAHLFNLLYVANETIDAQALASQGYNLKNPDRQIKQLETVLAHIHQNSTSSLTNAQLAKLAGMSESSFHRNFRQRIGCTPNSYIQGLRLSNVAQQLIESDSSISEIAFSGGYNNLSNFNNQFQRRFGCTPRTYRARHLAAHQEFTA
ncbi:MAG: AraC family transcriptional regulator [Verrucomicrobiota bacterium]